MSVLRDVAKALGLLALIVLGSWLVVELLFWWGMRSGVPTVP